MRTLALLAALALAACSNSAAPYDRCDINPTAGFAATHTRFGSAPQGAGSFGAWVVGPYGLPEYAYTLRQESDPRALWPNTEQKERREHWHLVGNARLNALAYNDGYLEVYTQERGLENLMRFDEASRNFGGGYSIIRYDEGESWSTAYRYRPAGARVARFFGMGYVRYETCDGVLRVTHTISAPTDDAGYLVDDIEVHNVTLAPVEFRHYAVWDVNRHYLAQQEVRSGTLNPKLPATMDAERDALNRALTTWGEDGPGYARVLNRAPEPTSPDVPVDVSLTPPDVFLRSDRDDDRFITDGAALWGESGDPRKPADLGAGRLARTNGFGQPGVLAAERSLRLAGGERAAMRYVVGAVPQDAALPPLPTRAEADDAAVTAERLVVFDADARAFDGQDIDAATLKREMAWHAYTLRNMGGYQDYFEHFVVNQGSAYWYKHGLDGAVRDFVFSAAVLAYIDPALARELLLYAARMRFESTGALAYTTGNQGRISAAVIHDKPSDLDLFWWWGLAEYVAATGDASILDDNEPFWPKHESPERPIHEHIKRGADYLRDEIGVGAHGLIRLRSGDWDDGITFFAPSRDEAKAVGESVANAMMAAFIAPWAAGLVAPYDVSTATQLKTLGDEQRARSAEQWTGRWYRRAWFGADQPFGDDAIFLFTSALGLIGEIPDRAQAKTLLANVGKYLEEKSTTSLYQFWYLKPPSVDIEGVTDPGASNPVISALAVWGFAQYDPARAWHALLRNTMARKAEVYPDIWYGIWSGPDAHYTNIHPQAGQTWASVATPQKDFPVLNSNQHNGPLLGLLRVAGLQPVMRILEGKPVTMLAIEPKVVAGHEYTLDTPLLKLALEDGAYTLTYRPVVDTTLRLALGLPTGAVKIGAVKVNGKAQPVADGATEVIVAVPVKQGKPVTLEVIGGAGHF